MARAATQNIGGLQLAVDRKLLDKPSVVEGQNFLVEVEGPRSAFAYEQMYRKLSHTAFSQSVNFGNKFFYFTFAQDHSEAMLFYLDWKEQQESLILEAVSPFKYAGYRISSARVGGKYYFAHRGFGVFEYISTTDKWENVTAQFPTDTFFITEAGGRCIALSAGYVSWSAIDDAQDFTPSTVTGAGAQSLSLIGLPETDEDYLGLNAVADGFVVFVAQGVLKGTIINSPLVFRFSPVPDFTIPLSSLCIAQISKSQIVILSTEGLQVTDGRGFKPWQPLMGEYLKNIVLPKMSDSVAGQIQLTYAPAAQWFFISHTYTQNVGLYDHAFVSYLPRDEWGSFDITHQGFIEVDTFGDASVVDLAFVSVDGRISKFEDQTSNLLIQEDTPTNPSDLQSAQFYTDKLLDAIGFIWSNIAYLSTNSRGSADWLVHENLADQQITWPTYPAVYEINGLVDTRTDENAADPIDVITDESGSPILVNTQSHYMRSEIAIYGFIRQQPKQTSLACKLTLGSFRFTDEMQHDQISLVNGLSVSMVDAQSLSATLQDWMALPNPDLIADWALGTPDVFVDWGYGLAGGVSYTCTVKGTLDAYVTWEDNEEVVTPFLIEGRTQFFSPNISGLYVLVDLAGLEQGSYMHLKHAEINGILAGRL